MWGGSHRDSKRDRKGELDPAESSMPGLAINFIRTSDLMFQSSITTNWTLYRTTVNTLVLPAVECSGSGLTLDPVVHTESAGTQWMSIPHRRSGLYQRRQQFTQPTTAVFTGFDLFFRFLLVAVPANQVITEWTP